MKDHLRDKLFLWTSFLSLGATAFLLAVIFYWTFQPFEPITFKPEKIPILNKDKKIKIGEPITTKIDFCVHHSVPVSTSRAIHEIGGNDRLVTLNNSRESVPEVGCRSVTSSSYKIPEFLLPGKYKITLTLIYKVNPLKTLSVTHETEQFEVIN